MGSVCAVPYEGGRWRYIYFQPQKTAKTWALSLRSSEPWSSPENKKGCICTHGVARNIFGALILKFISGVFEISQVSPLSSSHWDFTESQV